VVSTAALSGQITCGQWFLSDEVRRTWRETLNEVEHRDAHTAVMRYLTPTAVIVQVAWYEAAVARWRHQRDGCQPAHDLGSGR